MLLGRVHRSLLPLDFVSVWFPALCSCSSFITVDWLRTLFKKSCLSVPLKCCFGACQLFSYSMLATDALVLLILLANYSAVQRCYGERVYAYIPSHFTL